MGLTVKCSEDSTSVSIGRVGGHCSTLGKGSNVRFPNKASTLEMVSIGIAYEEISTIECHWFKAWMVAKSYS